MGLFAEMGIRVVRPRWHSAVLAHHACHLQPAEDTGTLTFTASRPPEEGLQAGAELRLHFRSLSRTGEIYVHSLVFVGLSKYVFNKNPGNSVRTRANLCFMEPTDNVTDLFNFHQNPV